MSDHLYELGKQLEDCQDEAHASEIIGQLAAEWQETVTFGNPIHQALAHRICAGWYQAAGRTEECRREMQTAVQMLAGTTTPECLAVWLDYGECLLDTGEASEAEQTVREAGKLAIEMKDLSAQSRAAFLNARLAGLQGASHGSITQGLAALELARQVKAHDFLIKICEFLVGQSLALGMIDQAMRHAECASETASELGNASSQARAQLLIAKIAEISGNASLVERAYQRAAEMLTTKLDLPVEAETYAGLARFFERTQRLEQALEYSRRHELASIQILTKRYQFQGYLQRLERRLEVDMLHAELSYYSKTVLPREIELRQRLADELERLATTDLLTGIWNRRHIVDLLRDEALRSQRFNRPLAVIIFDINKFRQINNQLGPAAGDQILVHVAHEIRNDLRTIDQVARFSGDQFVVLLPETNVLGARVVAERIRGKLVGQPVSTSFGNRKIGICLGIGGLSGFPGETWDGLIEQALNALAADKVEQLKRID